MKCNNCFKEIPNDADVCPYCGATIIRDIFSSSPKKEEAEDIFASSKNASVNFDQIDFESFQEPIMEDIIPEEQPTPKKSRKGLVALLISAILLVMAAFMVFVIFIGPSAKISGYLEKGNYSAALKVFEDNFEKEGGFILNARLEKRLESLYDDYKNGEKNFEESSRELKTIKKMGVVPLKSKTKATEKKLGRLKKSFSAFRRAEDFFSENNYELAIKKYREVVSFDPNYDTAKNKLEQAENKFRNDCLSKAEEYTSVSDYAMAIKTIENALEILKKDKLLTKRLETYKKSSHLRSDEQIISTAEALAAKKEYESAIATLSSAIKRGELKSRDKADKLLKYYRDEYEDIFKKELKNILKDHDYAAAAELIFKAEDIIPGSSVLKEEKEKISDKLPVYLDELSPSTASDWQFGGIALDSFGIDRSLESNVISLSVGSRASYELENEYASLVLTASASKEIDTTAECKLTITAEKKDSEPSIRECVISAKTQAQKITFDIKNCETLTFEVSGEGANIILSSIMLTKN